MNPPPNPSTIVNYSDFKFSCPVCQQHLACEEKQRGTQIQCPACKAQIIIPGALGLAAYAPSTDHGIGNYSPPVKPGQVPKIRIAKGGPSQSAG